MEKKVLVPLATGFETIEALSVVDVFRRAGVRVDLAAVGASKEVVSSHEVVVIADTLLEDCRDREYDLIVLPGGIPGAQNLQESETLKKLLIKQNQEQKLYGAICASPAVVLEHHGLLQDKEATCHPMFLDQLSSDKRGADGVVIDQNCVTSKGAGTSVDFSLELLEMLCGKEKRLEVARQMALA